MLYYLVIDLVKYTFTDNIGSFVIYFFLGYSILRLSFNQNFLVQNFNYYDRSLGELTDQINLMKARHQDFEITRSR